MGSGLISPFICIGGFASDDDKACAAIAGVIADNIAYARVDFHQRRVFHHRRKLFAATVRIGKCNRISVSCPQSALVRVGRIVYAGSCPCDGVRFDTSAIFKRRRTLCSAVAAVLRELHRQCHF